MCRGARREEPMLTALGTRRSKAIVACLCHLLIFRLEIAKIAARSQWRLTFAPRESPMKSIAFAPCAKLILLAALLNVIGAIHRASAGTITDPVLTLAINGTNQTAVLSWFGVAGVTYQLESSSDLATWTDSGPAVTGTGDFLMSRIQLPESSRSFSGSRRPA